MHIPSILNWFIGIFTSDAVPSPAPPIERRASKHSTARVKRFNARHNKRRRS